MRKKTIYLNLILISIVAITLICAFNLSGYFERTMNGNNSTTSQLLDSKNVTTSQQMQTKTLNKSYANWSKESISSFRENNKTVVLLHFHWTKEGVPVAKEGNKTVIIPGASLLGIPIVEIKNYSITIKRGECVNDNIRFVPRNDGLANFTVKAPKVLRVNLAPSKFYAIANVEYSLNLKICTLPNTPKGSYKVYIYVDFPIQPPPRRYQAYTWIAVSVK